MKKLLLSLLLLGFASQACRVNTPGGPSGPGPNEPRQINYQLINEQGEGIEGFANLTIFDASGTVTETRANLHVGPAGRGEGDIPNCPSKFQISATAPGKFPEVSGPWGDGWCGHFKDSEVIRIMLRQRPVAPSPPVAVLPPPPSREALITGFTDFQGFDCDRDGDGRPEIVWESIMRTLPLDQRERIYACKRAYGHKNIDLTLDQGGLATLDAVIAHLKEAIIAGFNPILHLMGDGNGCVNGEEHCDPGALGYYWLYENFPTVYGRLRAAQLVDPNDVDGNRVVLTPAYDGMIPQWIRPSGDQRWRRVEDFIKMARPILGKTPMCAYAAGGFGFSYSGEEGTGDWNSPEGRLWDCVLIETPDPPTGLLRNLTAAEIAAYCTWTDDQRTPFDGIWQIANRLLGPRYNAPPDQRELRALGFACADNTTHPGIDHIVTDRGRFYGILHEYLTYQRVRQGNYTQADVNAARARARALGYQWVN